MADTLNISIEEQTIELTVEGVSTWDSLAGKPTAVAESSFIASGATPFAWVVKTLAQVKTILGLGDKVDKVIGSSLVVDTEILKIHESGSDNQDLSVKINHSLATAENDVLVGKPTPFGEFVKKTIAEFKSILGLGSAAYTASTDYKVATFKGWYDAEKVNVPGSGGTLTLKMATETFIIDSLTNAHSFTVALPAGVVGQVNESILIFKIGATLPAITQPGGIVWRGVAPTLAINTTWTIAYESVNTTGTTFEIYAVAVKNV